MFSKLNLSKQLMNAIDKLNFKKPTQIQKDSIPLILEGKDIIGQSATGSGKTLAFGTGIVEKCEPNQGLQAIILLPTRELAEQVKDEMIKISHKKNLHMLAIYGGVAIGPQMDKLKKANVVIATPGRCLDHLQRNSMDLSKVKVVVLDEADRMVEMGFIEDVQKIIQKCPKQRQTLLFSATMYGPAKTIAKKYMKDPVVVHAEKMVDPSKLTQIYYDVPSKLKADLLVHLLKKDDSDLVMVFCNTRRATDLIVDVLKANNVKCAPIHGGLNQSKRLKTIDMFHKGKFQILICTDVAARGLHIEGVTHIYNFDIPNETNDYIHRIGRTARAGGEGIVINLIARRDYDNFSRLINAHRDFNIEKVDRPFIESNSKTTQIMNKGLGGSRNNKRSSGNFRKGNSRKRSDNRSSSNKGGVRRNSSSRRSPGNRNRRRT